MQREEILQRVRLVVSGVFNVSYELEDITMDFTLEGDLGAESIDFLDLVQRLEREFSIKIPRNELFPESIFQGDPELVQNGKVTEKGLQEMREKMPFADLSQFEENPVLTEISDLFTVGMLVKYVEWKLAQKKPS